MKQHDEMIHSPSWGTLLGLFACFVLPACGGSSDGDTAHQDRGGHESGDGDGSGATDGDGDGTGSGGGDGNGGSGGEQSGFHADLCAEPMPAADCAAGWICYQSNWSCGVPGGPDDSDLWKLEGTECTPYDVVTDRCTVCACLDDGHFECLTPPDCGVLPPEPEPGSPEWLDGRSCDGGDAVEFDHATCTCLPQGTYECAYILEL